MKKKSVVVVRREEAFDKVLSDQITRVVQIEEEASRLRELVDLYRCSTPAVRQRFRAIIGEAHAALEGKGEQDV